MLVKLYPNQIKKYWDVIEEAMDASLPDPTPESKKLLAQDLVLERATCWMISEEVDGSAKIRGLSITKMADDYAVGGRVMTIVVTYAPDRLTEQLYHDCFRDLARHALAHNCKRVDFYTDNPSVIAHARAFPVKWETKYFQLSLE